jgi:hypothetical protein
MEQPLVVFPLVDEGSVREGGTRPQFIAEHVREVQEERDWWNETDDETRRPHEGLRASRVTHGHIALHSER